MHCRERGAESGRCPRQSHQDKFHVVCMSDVQIGDAALFIRNEVLQFGGWPALMMLFMVKFSFFKMISV